MNGIDISAYQKGLDLSKINADFVIIKATEGTYMRQSIAKEFYADAVASGKLVGFYHFAAGQDAIKEADYFVDYIAPYVGKALLALDWEGEAVKKGPSWAKVWLDRVYERTGAIPVIYMNHSTTNGWNWAKVAEKYPLWGAQYADYKIDYGYQDKPWDDGKPWGAWGDKLAIRQYTSVGRLTGYERNLDLNKGYLTESGWLALAGTEIETPKPVLKPVSEIAEEVLAGKWDNGQERVKLLTKAGYDYGEIQNEVNLIFYAKEVLLGKWDNGQERIERLTKAHLDAEAIQKKVNELLGF